MKKKLHITLLALLLVFVPPYFLVFTEEGNRVSDNALLWLFGQEDFNFNLAEAGSDFSREQVLKAYPDIDWTCGRVDSPFGTDACNAVIGSFNDLPAHRAVVFFADQQLSAVQIIYRAQYHAALLQQLLDTLGRPEVDALAANAPEADVVLQWNTGKGTVVLKKTIRESDQPALLWIGSAHQ